ncbi:MAG: N-6 DNA methylase [Deltaproteobacteria bacterium]|nr:N-6 DNA methylase [Deltaproteobacteria bacterium]
MQLRQRVSFTTLHAEGAILPADLLQRIAAGDRNLTGLTPEDYHLDKGERLNEATNRAWNRLVGTWATFREARAKLSPGDLGTTITRERWLLPLCSELGYGRLLTAKAIEVEGKSYPISHGWQHAPIHLVGCRVELDTRTAGVAGASRSSPHGLVQELLNRSDKHLWGFVSNGLRLRILRDNSSLTRQAYVEFDLEAMMEGEVYADFVLLWLLCHESRVEAERPAECWLERWSRTAQEQGTRALDQLRVGVEEAITALGRGFLVHPANQGLRDKLRSGTLEKHEYYRQLLRLVYRLLFLFVAEDRDLLLNPQADVAARDRYQRFYSTAKLRRLAERRVGTRHADLYHGLRLIIQKLGSDTGCPELALPALGSFLFSTEAVPDLEGCEISNHALLDAIRALAFSTDSHSRRLVDYKNLGSEELGSVYESLLELHPILNVDAGAFELKTAGGHERKTTGSYYTPTSLIQCLLDSALDPVLEEAARQENPEAAILKLKVCDPACGSGHFLIAAAHRIAKHLATIRTGDDEPSPDAIRTALRDVIGHCIYGVDVNPMAVELCKVSLWMEALEPGKPLSFLDHRIQCGNSLLGATPALLKKGIPDEAFDPIEGDDKEVCRKFKKLNREERKGQGSLFDASLQPWERLGDLAAGLLSLEEISDDTIAGVRHKQERYEGLVRSSGYLYGRLWADAWCAAFVWKKTKEFPYPITEEVFHRIEQNPFSIASWMREEIQQLAKQYQFFHWHLVFPDVFWVPTGSEEPENAQAGWSGGFDVVLGNPPWERVKLQEKEFFVERSPEIASASNAAVRKRLITQLVADNPSLMAEFQTAQREAEGESHFMRNSGTYPLCGRGDINLYTIFAEAASKRLAPPGRMGLVLPSGIATDDTTKFYFQDVIDTRSLVSLFDFENKGIFPGVHSSYKFCLFTAGSGRAAPAGRKDGDAAEFAFFAHSVDDLQDPKRRYTLSAEDIARLNPDTRTCPIFRSSLDAGLTKTIYAHTTIVGASASSGGWGVDYLLKLVDPTIHRDLLVTEAEALRFRTGEATAESLEGQALPLYEGKQIHHFDHRYATFDGGEECKVSLLDDKLKAGFSVMPRYWLRAADFKARLQGRPIHYHAFLSVRDIARVTDERSFVTAIRSFVPALNSLGNLFCCSASDALFLCGCLNSYAADYVARQKVGGTHLSPFYLMQLAVASPSNAGLRTPWSEPSTARRWVEERVLELTYTAWDLELFAQDCGWSGPPFCWDEERRFLLRCELDAAFFHLYRITREDVDYIMETFPIVKRKDEKKYGEYRTKRVILEIYDAMAEAIGTGKPYQTLLDPPPADPRMAHPLRQNSAAQSIRL